MLNQRHLRLAVIAAVAIFAASASAASADSTPSHAYARLRLGSAIPNTPTSAYLRLIRATLPSGKPKAETLGVFSLPEGTKINLNAVPPCTKDDTTLQIEGPLACPDSFIGTGYVTLYTGLGPPVDPIPLDQEWYYAPSQLVQLVTYHGTKMPVVAVLRADIKGATFTAKLNLPPGWPPGTTMAPKETDLTLNKYVGPHGAFITTPPICPPSGVWVSTVKLYYSDNTSDTINDAMPCVKTESGRGMPRRRHHRKARHHRRHRHRQKGR